MISNKKLLKKHHADERRSFPGGVSIISVIWMKVYLFLMQRPRSDCWLLCLLDLSLAQEEKSIIVFDGKHQWWRDVVGRDGSYMVWVLPGCLVCLDGQSTLEGAARWTHVIRIMSNTLTSAMNSDISRVGWSRTIYWWVFVHLCHNGREAERIFVPLVRAKITIDTIDMPSECRQIEVPVLSFQIKIKSIVNCISSRPPPRICNHNIIVTVSWD